MPELTRRDCLIIGGSTVAALGLAGCAPVARRFEASGPDLLLPAGDVHPTVRLLCRAGFGPRPGDVARVTDQGHNSYLQTQLAANSKEDLGLIMQLERLDVLQLDDPDTEDLPQAEIIRQLQQAAILRAVHGNNQLLERMVDFWSNHFNVYARKGDSAFRLGTDQRQVIRANALGTFPNLLRASTRSAAMLAFLDNPQNLKSHPNENYARELMELHTLGIGGGYSQKDVQEVARCFTGWTIETRFLRPRGKLRFDPERHDDGQKLVLGHVIPAGGGEADAESVLQILATHPSTAHFIAGKLVKTLHGGDDAKLQSLVASEYRRTGGDIPSMLKPLFQPDVLAAAPPIMKRPFEFIVSSIRAVGGYTDGNTKIQSHLDAMGEPLYQWPMPDGYPIKTSAWASNMLPRWNFAYEFASGHVTGTNFEGEVDPYVKTQYRAPGGDRLSELIKRANPQEALALGLSSPNFQWW
jgi:uncharacterized protein (DUF1800 family)